MSGTELVAGLDIGTTKVCAVIAEVQPGGHLEIIGEGLEPSKGLQKGVVTDIESTVQAIRAAVDKAQRVAGAQISSVFVGVTGEHIASLNSRGIVAITHAQRVVRQEDVDRAIDSSRVIVLPPEREIIHAIPRGYAIDGQDGVRFPVGMSGSRLEVETHIVHGISTFLLNLAKCVERAGLSVESFVLQSFAAAKAVLGENERSLGVALIDIGGGTTDIAVYMNDSILHSAVLGVGGNHVTQDIAVGLQCSIADAEHVKINYGCASTDTIAESDTFAVKRIGSEAASHLPRKLLGEIIEPRMTEILQLAAEAIDKGPGRGKLTAGAILTGGTSLMSGTGALGERILEMPVRLGRLSGVGGITGVVSDPQHATGVGLAICASEQCIQNGHGKPGKGVSGLFTKLKEVLMGTD